MNVETVIGTLNGIKRVFEEPCLCLVRMGVKENCPGSKNKRLNF
jgi:hypothetical protein